MIDISIIIVNYNTLDITEKCLCSIENQTEGVSYEIILVDNASTDGSKDYFSKRSGIVFVWNSENIGFGRANNLGFQKSKGRYVLLLNSDTILLNNALKLFVDAADKEPDIKVGCWGAMLVDTNNEITHSYGKFPTPGFDIFKETILIPYSKLTNGHFNLQQGTKYPQGYVDYIIGADLLIRRDVIEKYGLFNPLFFMYYEDAELLWRYRQSGIMARIIEGPVIMHLEGGSAKRPKRKTLARSIMQLKSKLTYFSLAEPRWKFLMYKFLLLIIRIPFFIFSRYTVKEKMHYIKTIINE